MDDNFTNLNNLNEGYLKEMEANNYLFEEKIKKLNNLLSSNNNLLNDRKKISEDNKHKNFSDISSKPNLYNYDFNKFDNNDNNEINTNDDNQYLYYNTEKKNLIYLRII